MQRQKPEQIEQHERSRGHRRWAKRIAHRFMRRAWKIDPVNAPKKYEFGGYTG